MVGPEYRLKDAPGDKSGAPTCAVGHAGGGGRDGTEISQGGCL